MLVKHSKGSIFHVSQNSVRIFCLYSVEYRSGSDRKCVGRSERLVFYRDRFKGEMLQVIRVSFRVLGSVLSPLFIVVSSVEAST